MSYESEQKTRGYFGYLGIENIYCPPRSCKWKDHGDYYKTECGFEFEKGKYDIVIHTCIFCAGKVTKKQ